MLFVIVYYIIIIIIGFNLESIGQVPHLQINAYTDTVISSERSFNHRVLLNKNPAYQDIHSIHIQTNTPVYEHVQQTTTPVYETVQQTTTPVYLNVTTEYATFLILYSSLRYRTGPVYFLSCKN